MKNTYRKHNSFSFIYIFLSVLSEFVP